MVEACSLSVHIFDESYSFHLGNGITEILIHEFEIVLNLTKALNSRVNYFKIKHDFQKSYLHVIFYFNSN